MSLFDNPAPTLNDFMGEGKKYANEDAVAKALVEKDNFIEQLKREAAEARNEVLRQPVTPVPDRSQEILDRLEALSRPAAPVVQPEPAQERPANTLTFNDIDAYLEKREAENRAARNIEAAKTELEKKFGPQYTSVLKSLSETMGVSTAFLEGVAKQSPAALMKLLENEKPPASFTPPPSSVSPQFVPNTDTAHNNRAYYDKLKATDKAKYFSQEVQMKMYKDAMALGEAFYS